MLRAPVGPMDQPKVLNRNGFKRRAARPRKVVVHAAAKSPVAQESEHLIRCMTEAGSSAADFDRYLRQFNELMLRVWARRLGCEVSEIDQRFFQKVREVDFESYQLLRALASDDSPLLKIKAAGTLFLRSGR